MKLKTTTICQDKDNIAGKIWSDFSIAIKQAIQLVTYAFCCLQYFTTFEREHLNSQIYFRANYLSCQINGKRRKNLEYFEMLL